MQEQWIYGIHAVKSVLQRSPSQVKRLLIQEGRSDKSLQAIIGAAKQNKLSIENVSRRELDLLFPQSVHQGVAVRFTPQESFSENDLDRLLDQLIEPPLLLILDGIQDPHNLGACLRTADAAGVHAVITTKDRAASLTPTARKVASGAAEFIPFIQVTNLARTLRYLREREIWLLGMAEEGETNLYHADLTKATGLILGAEGVGLRRLTREHCDELLAIPMAGAVSSLNVSVATGVCLFEVVRQRNFQNQR